MTSGELTNLLIIILISLVGFIANLFVKKIERFERTIQNILISDVANKKDITSIQVELDNHERRIVKLEN
jgi:hypothetical protein